MSAFCFPNGLATPPEVTTGYMGYPGHNGTDSINHPGRRNRAPAAGTVVYAGYNPSGAGNEVAIIVDGSGERVRELHFATGGIVVSVGQHVELGEDLGEQGATGDATGIHCHLEIWPNNSIAQRLDPWPYVAARIAVIGAGGSSSPFNNGTTGAKKMYGLFQRIDAGQVTLALGILDPAWAYKGHNFWAEATLEQRADWVAQWGTPIPLRTDVWNSRSNDPNRIADLAKFPLLAGGGGSVAWSPSPADLAAIGAAVKPVDVQPILAAIAAGETQDAKDLQTLLAAIAGVDEATLATFGLKRA